MAIDKSFDLRPPSLHHFSDQEKAQGTRKKDRGEISSKRKLAKPCGNGDSFKWDGQEASNENSGMLISIIMRDQAVKKVLGDQMRRHKIANAIP